MSNFNEVTPLCCWVQKILPLVYDDSLSYYELLNKVVKKLNDLIKNNSALPDYIQELIEQYISSGTIETVISTVIANYILNVKYPPSGLTPAVGNGTADDTLAIQGCIDYATAHGGMAVYFPSGKYLTQSLSLKDNVTLFGFDSSTTRLVLKGGAFSPLLHGETINNTISGLALDGNSDIQVNNVNLIVLKGGLYNFNNVVLTDGFDLLTLNITDAVTMCNVIFGNAIESALTTSGTGIINANSLTFKNLSVLNGKYCIDNKVNNAVFTDIYSTANTVTAIRNNSNNSVFVGKIVNAVNTHENLGVDNYFDFYNRGGTVKTLIDNEAANRENADAALQTNIESEALARENADAALQTNIESEALARENADAALQTRIESEVLDRETAIAEIENEILLSKLYVNVKNFGATGDGITNDTVAINNALSYLKNNGRGTLFFPAGTYLFTPPLKIDVAHIYIKGSGSGSSVLLANSATGNIIEIGASPAFVGSGIENIQIACTEDRISGYAITINGCEKYFIKNVLLFRYNDKQTGDGIYFGDTSGIGFINQCDMEFKGNFNGIVISGSNDRYFTDLWLRGDNISSGSTGVAIRKSGGDWFNNVEIVQFTEGLLIAPTLPDRVSWINLQNVLTDNNSLRGVRIDGTGEVEGINFANCWSSTNGPNNINARGVYIAKGKGIMFSNFRCINNGGHGIEISNTPQNIQINGGLFNGNSQAKAGVAHGIITNCKGFLLTGVRSGTFDDSVSKQGYGLYIQANCDYYIVSNNDFRNNVTGGVMNVTTPDNNKLINNNIGV